MAVVRRFALDQAVFEKSVTPQDPDFASPVAKGCAQDAVQLMMHDPFRAGREDEHFVRHCFQELAGAPGTFEPTAISAGQSVRKGRLASEAQK